MTEKEYNAVQAVRRSDLWRMNESAEKYLWAVEHEVEPTPAMLFGAACHKYILEPESFGLEYIVAPQVDRRTKEGKAAWDAFVAAAEGRTAVSGSDFEIMMAMQKKLLTCAPAMALLRGKSKKSAVEAPFFWKDPDTGEQCKIRCDRVHYDPKRRRFTVIDYKTTASANTAEFSRDVIRMGYHVQAAMYTEGVQKAKRLKYRPDFVFVAQEKREPYSVNVIRVSPAVMELGDAAYHKLLEQVHTCKELDWWPGYCDDGVNETELPGWALVDGEE